MRKYLPLGAQKDMFPRWVNTLQDFDVVEDGRTIDCHFPGSLAKDKNIYDLVMNEMMKSGSEVTDAHCFQTHRNLIKDAAGSLISISLARSKGIQSV